MSERFGGYQDTFKGEPDQLIEQIRWGLYAAVIMTYAQGMELLRSASEEYKYDLDLSDVARIWRGGCIIRSALLEPIREAYAKRPGLRNLLLDNTLGLSISDRIADLRAVAQTGIGLGIPVPGFTAALTYFDCLRARRLPANLIQAQRDYFGAHTYERVDKQGIFHTEWGKE